MNNILEATNISKKFGEFQALSDVSIQIKKNSIFRSLRAQWCWKNHPFTHN
jgi:ABC-type branched-subunit amino acid transport system ATPase component